MSADAGAAPFDPTTRPIVFISRFHVKDGHEGALRAMWATAPAALGEAKPRTAVFLAYLSADGRDLSIIHAFPDAAAMVAHFEGADDRASAAYAHIEPAGWEIYGAADEGSRSYMEAAAANAGVPLTLQPNPIGGFLRAPIP